MASEFTLRLQNATLLLGLLTLGLGFRPMLLPDAPSECGDPDAALPGFSLVDQNPNSATYGAPTGLDAYLGQVVVVYWAQAT